MHYVSFINEAVNLRQINSKEKEKEKKSKYGETSMNARICRPRRSFFTLAIQRV